MKFFASIAIATLLASAPAFANVITAPISLKYDGIFKTSGLVGLGAMMQGSILKDLNKAVTDACGDSFVVLDLDTHLTVSQPDEAGTATYGLEGSVTCRNNQ